MLLVKIIVSVLIGVVVSAAAAVAGFAVAVGYVQVVLAKFGLKLTDGTLEVVSEEVVWDKLLLPLARAIGQFQHVVIGGGNGRMRTEWPPEVA